MSIDQRCKEQLKVADQMFMDFKYTRTGSREQIRALQTFAFLVSMWADYFLQSEANRMEAALAIEPKK